MKTKRKIQVFLLAGILGAALLSGCADDWDDWDEELTDEVTEAVNVDDGSRDDGISYYEGLKLGSGLETGTVKGELSDNPGQVVRRSVTPVSQVLITRLDGSRVPEDFYMYRNTLDSKGQRAYDQICAGCAAGQGTIVMSTLIDEEELQYIFNSVVYDHPEFFWLKADYYYYYNGDGYITELYPSYYTQDISGMAAEVEQSVSGALASMWGLSSDVEKVKYAHDYLTNTIDYVRNDMDQTAYSGFVWNQTVCVGYAKCFSYMMHKMGIPCTVVTGSTNGGNHAWNILELDGEYYLMDVTWDDPVGNPADTYYYNYFNITDDQMAADHSTGTFVSSNGDYIDISRYLPAANGTRYSFQNAFGGNAYGTDFGSISEAEPEMVADSETDTSDGYGNDGDYTNDWDYTNDGDYANDGDYTGDWDYTNDGDYTDAGNYTDDGDYTCDVTGTCGDYDWWNLLDDSWTKDDWEYDDGYYFIWDEETRCIYVYAPDLNIYGAMEEDGEEIYWYDPDCGQWIAE